MLGTRHVHLFVDMRAGRRRRDTSCGGESRLNWTSMKVFTVLRDFSRLSAVCPPAFAPLGTYPGQDWFRRWQTVYTALTVVGRNLCHCQNFRNAIQKIFVSLRPERHSSKGRMPPGRHPSCPLP